LKLHTDTNSALNTVTAYGAGFVEINNNRYAYAIAFGPEGEITRWPASSPSDISTDLLYMAAGITMVAQDPMAFLDADENTPPKFTGTRPEVLLVGTGSKHLLLPHRIVQPLLKIGIGVECMSTQAAARTYNILMAEGRQVIAALLPEVE
jgi:uncharacterized protein